MAPGTCGAPLPWQSWPVQVVVELVVVAAPSPAPPEPEPEPEWGPEAGVVEVPVELRPPPPED
jgi:hypothetical protein